MISDRNRIFDDIIENSGFLNNIFEKNNIGIIGGRMSAKTSLSVFIILKYINSLNYHPLIYSMYRDNTTKKLNQLGHYCNSQYSNNLSFNSKLIDDISTIPKAIKSLQGSVIPDVMFIDEIYHWKFTDYERDTFFGILNAKKVKIIFNTTIPDWTKTEYMDKLKKSMDFTLIDDKMLENLRGYNINLKLKNIMNRIDG